jgi:hypothetical protein
MSYALELNTDIASQFLCITDKHISGQKAGRLNSTWTFEGVNQAFTQTMNGTQSHKQAHCTKIVFFPSPQLLVQCNPYGLANLTLFLWVFEISF